MSTLRTLALVGLMAFLSLAVAHGDSSTPPLRMGGGEKPTGVCRLAVAPDGQAVAWAGSGPVCLYNPTSGKLLRSLKIDGRCLAFAPDGKTLAVGEGATVHVFNVGTGEEVASFKAHAESVLAVAFSPDGKTLATGGDDDHVGLWDAVAGKERSRLELHEKGASVLAFSRDGKFLTAGGEAGELTVWRMEDEDERRRLVGRDGGVSFAAFAPDSGSFLWTQGQTIRVSEMDTWVELSRYNCRDRDADVDAVGFALSPDGKTLATGGGKSIRLWDLETGDQLLLFHDDKTEAATVAFTPDGKTLLSAGLDGAVLVWDLKGLPAARQEALWNELGGRDAADAVHAVRAMKAAPAESVAFLRERIRPAPPPDPLVVQLIADLDSDDFAVREKATADLAKRGRTVEPELQKAYANQPTPEARWRLETLLAKQIGRAHV